jgi:hypothetical protein
MKKTGLPLRALPQGVGPKLNLIIVVVKPEDIVTVLLEFQIVKASWIGPEKVEHLTFCKHRPQINDASEAILPNDFDDAE